MKRVLFGLLALAILAGVVLGGQSWIEVLRWRSWDAPPNNGIVRAHPEFGHGEQVAVGWARVFPGGVVEVAVEGESGRAISAVEIEESDAEVRVHVRAVFHTADSDLIPRRWWVRLNGVNLKGRTLIGSDGQPMKVTHCDVTSPLRLDQQDPCWNYDF